jgi:succinate dehydrogenase hydrophobic anchor subunit
MIACPLPVIPPKCTDVPSLILSYCYSPNAPLRCAFSWKIKKKIVNFFFSIFLAIEIPHPIWGLPAKIWGVYSLGNPKRALISGVHMYFEFFYVLSAHYIALLGAI